MFNIGDIVIRKGFDERYVIEGFCGRTIVYAPVSKYLNLYTCREIVINDLQIYDKEGHYIYNEFTSPVTYDENQIELDKQYLRNQKLIQLGV